MVLFKLILFLATVFEVEVGQNFWLRSGLGYCRGWWRQSVAGWLQVVRKTGSAGQPENLACYFFLKVKNNRKKLMCSATNAKIILYFIVFSYLIGFCLK